MTAEMHTKTFMAYRAEGVGHPSKAAYQQHFSRMWEEGMSANDKVGESSCALLFCSKELDSENFQAS